MSNLTLRIEKGSPLTHQELDQNFNLFIQPITSNDNITQHLNADVSVNTKSFVTIFNLSGSHEIIGGIINAGNNGGLRITIDGAVIIDERNSNRGTDNSGNQYNSIYIPPCRSKLSLKLEGYNNAAITRLFGWRIWTRQIGE